MELDSGADSVTSTPRSSLHQDDTTTTKSIVRLMCSFGGKILPRPHDNQLRYVGGDTRIVAVNRSISFSSLLSKLSKLIPSSTSSSAADSFTVKYQLPHEDLDALITVSTDEDVDNMMEEFDRLVVQQQQQQGGTKVVVVPPRLRLFLFPNNLDNDGSRTSSIVSLLDGSMKRESWFLDALNGDRGGGGLERGRSEASSIVSEVPDYLFGLDNSDEPVPAKFRTRSSLADVVVAGSDPGSPAFGSTSSAPPMPNLPPVKTKPVQPVEEVIESPVQPPVGFTGGPVWSQTPNPGSPYRGHPAPMQAIPVYYVPAGQGPNPVTRGHAHMQAMQVPGPGQYVQQYGPQGQVPVQVGYTGSGPIYGGGAGVRQVDPYEMQMQQGNMVQGQGQAGQPIYYGIRNAGQHPGMVAAYPGMYGSDDGNGSGVDSNKGRAHQG